MSRKDKGRKWDGKSRVSNDLYRKRWDEVFGKKIKKDEEITGYYYNGYADKPKIKVLTEKKIDDPFKKEVKEGKISNKEFKKIVDRNGF